jgi:hypothetical protein
MNVRDAAQAKSRTLSAVKRQVRVPNSTRGREAGSVTSSAPRMITVVSPVRARASRWRCVTVSTVSGLRSVPVAATSMSAGTVRLTSKLPYSR